MIFGIQLRYRRVPLDGLALLGESLGNELSYGTTARHSSNGYRGTMAKFETTASHDL
jgi:hypothetical protein